MSLSKDDILNAIAEMSVMDVVALVEAMEEKFGVTAAAAVAAAPAAALPQGDARRGEARLAALHGGRDDRLPLPAAEALRHRGGRRALVSRFQGCPLPRARLRFSKRRPLRGAGGGLRVCRGDDAQGVVLSHEPQVGDVKTEAPATVGRPRPADGARRALSVPAGFRVRRGPERDGALVAFIKGSGTARPGTDTRPPRPPACR